MASTRCVSTLIDKIRDPANHAAMQSNELRQPLSWLVFCLDLPEEQLVRVCEEVLEVCPEAAAVPNQRGELPLHLSAELGYVQVSAALLRAHPEGAQHRTVEARQDEAETGVAATTVNGAPLRVSHDFYHGPGDLREYDSDDLDFLDSDDDDFLDSHEILPHGMLPIHLLAKGGDHHRDDEDDSDDDDDDDDDVAYEDLEEELFRHHVRLLHAAYPEGLTAVNSEGQTPLHLSASSGRRASCFLELLRLCPEAALHRDVVGERPVDSLVRPDEVLDDRFGARTPEIVVALVNADPATNKRNSLSRLELWLREDRRALGLDPVDDDDPASDDRLVSRPIPRILATQETLATLVHLLHEARTTGTVAPARRHTDYRPHHKYLVHRALAAELPEETFSCLLLLHHRLARHAAELRDVGGAAPNRRLLRHLDDFCVDDRLSLRDENGDLPLHVAVRRPWPVLRTDDDDDALSLLRRVVHASPPGAAATLDARGMLPLRSVVAHNGGNVEAVAIIFDAFPPAHAVPYRGLLPVHAAMTDPRVDPAVTHLLLRASPDVLLPALRHNDDDDDIRDATPTKKKKEKEKEERSSKRRRLA